MNIMTTSTDYESILWSAVKDSATIAQKLKAIYEKYISIAGSPETDAAGNLTCINCGDKFKDTENNNLRCMYDADSHKGLFLANENSDAWYGWHEANPPKGSSYWKENRNGGHRWTGCGCTSSCIDECERQEEKHRAEGQPPPVDDWFDEDSADLSDSEFDVDDSQTRGQDTLIANYIHELSYNIKNKIPKDS